MDMAIIQDNMDTTDEDISEDNPKSKIPNEKIAKVLYLFTEKIAVKCAAGSAALGKLVRPSYLQVM